MATGLRKITQNPGSQISGSTPLLRSVRPVLELFEDPGPSIQGEATQMARNITSPGIELGRAATHLGSVGVDVATPHLHKGRDSDVQAPARLKPQGARIVNSAERHSLRGH